MFGGFWQTVAFVAVAAVVAMCLCVCVCLSLSHSLSLSLSLHMPRRCIHEGRSFKIPLNEICLDRAFSSLSFRTLHSFDSNLTEQFFLGKQCLLLQGVQSSTVTSASQVLMDSRGLGTFSMFAWDSHVILSLDSHLILSCSKLPALLAVQMIHVNSPESKLASVSIPSKCYK